MSSRRSKETASSSSKASSRRKLTNREVELQARLEQAQGKSPKQIRTNKHGTKLKENVSEQDKVNSQRPVSGRSGTDQAAEEPKDAPSLLFAAAAEQLEANGALGAIDFGHEAECRRDGDEYDDYADDDFEDDDSGGSGSNLNGLPSKQRYSEDRTRDEGGEPPPTVSKEIAVIMAAMKEENRRVLPPADASPPQGSTMSRSPSSRADSSSLKDHAPYDVSAIPKINFRRAQGTTRNKSHSKAAKRAADILKIVELDVVTMTLFEMAPISEYEMYIRRYGSSNTAQQAIQTNDDCCTREVQTNVIEMRTKWTQEPPDDLAGSGIDPTEVHLYDTDDEEKRKQDVDRLGLFVAAAGPVCSMLLEENLVTYSRRGDIRTVATGLDFSESVTQLSSTMPLLAGRHVTYAHFSEARPHMVLTAYNAPPSATLGDAKGCICVWNLYEPSQPQKLLASASIPTCCCFSPGKAAIAMSSSTDGSIEIWDLREPALLHKKNRAKDSATLLRCPTYSTDGISAADSHSAPIIAMESIADRSQESGSTLSHSNDGFNTIAFQLATLDSTGLLKTWTVIELANASSAGSVSELGLHPGGRVKIVPSSSITLSLSARADVGLLQATCFRLFPGNPNRLVVGTNLGWIIHGVRFGGRIAPRSFSPPSHLAGHTIDDITAIDFSPWDSDVFLAGTSGGVLRLYRSNLATPVICWPIAGQGSGLTKVLWSRHRPGIAYVLDNGGRISVWDFPKRDDGPVMVQQIGENCKNSGRAVWVSALAISKDTVECQNGHGDASLLVGMSNGAVEVHKLKSTWAAMEPGDEERWKHWLDVNA